MGKAKQGCVSAGDQLPSDLSEVLKFKLHHRGNQTSRQEAALWNTYVVQ